MSLDEHLNKPVDCPFLADCDVEGFAAADRTIISLLVLEGVRIYAVRADQHEIVVEICRRTCRDLEGFITT